MRKNVNPHAERSHEEIALLLAEARNNERLRCAGVTSGRLEALAAFIATQRLEWCDAAELLRQEASHIDNQAQELH
jgi:hypothetical protein